MHNWKELFKIEFNDWSPIYFQIAMKIKKIVQNGTLLPGELLPSEQEMGDYFNVSRLTMRRAVSELVQDGWLLRKKGMGTYVADPNVRKIIPRTLGFTSKMLAMGLNPESRILNRGIIPATQDIAKHLRINLNDQVIEIYRLRLIDQEPVMLEKTWLSATRFPKLLDADLHNQSLYTFLLSTYQVEVNNIDQNFRPIVLTAEQSAHLGVAKDSLALESTVLAFDKDKHVIEFSRSLTRDDKCQFVFHFREIKKQD